MDKKAMEIAEVLNRLGNNVVMLGATARNLGVDYDRLVRLLREFAGEDNFKEPMTISDRLVVEHRDKEGNLINRYDSGWSRNGITNAGFAEVAKLIGSGLGGTAFGYVAIGTGTTAYDATQTTLVTETARKSASVSNETTTVTGDTVQFQATFSSADGLSGSDAIAESGVFNASSGGTMLCRQTFSVLNINWDAGDTLTVTWKVQIKQGT